LACASSRPSGCAFQPASSSRLPPTFQLCLRTCLQLAPRAVPGSAFMPISSLRLPSTFRPTDRACLQLAPSTSLSGSAFRFASGLRRRQPSSPAFRPNLRLSSNVLFSGWPLVRLQLAPSTHLVCSTFWPDLQLASPTLPSSPPFDQPATRAACQSLAHLSTVLQLAPSFSGPVPLSC